jgi:hypothetical protein
MMPPLCRETVVLSAAIAAQRPSPPQWTTSWNGRLAGTHVDAEGALVSTRTWFGEPVLGAVATRPLAGTLIVAV